MAQLREEYGKFETRDAAFVVLGPEKAETFVTYWEKENLQFIGLPDPKHSVLKLYGQQIKLFKLGRMPAQIVSVPRLPFNRVSTTIVLRSLTTGKYSF